MAEDSYTLNKRFHTPDPRLKQRKQSAMSDQELAEARLHAGSRLSSWLQILLVPVIFGSVLPCLLFLLSLMVYASLFASHVDIDQAIDDYIVWALAATPLFMGGWALYNTLRARHDVTERYWKTMPDEGLVDTETHTLTWAINLWSSCYDPDASTMHRWIDGELKSVPDSGISQWLLAKNTTGQWLVVRHAIQGTMHLLKKPDIPAVNLQLQPTQDLVLTFAPQTNLCLNKRFSGTALPVVQSGLWLSQHEALHLSDIAHHWQFFYPQRYGLVSQEDARWVDDLVDRAQRNMLAVASETVS
ncbi:MULTISPECIES: hypothetical protein [Pseudomonas syringae group]|uniref:Uncharacterized protein n=1 Tax=Pseudomonas syringae pv. primulae TaxID=251707 RepID=A0A0N8SJB9_9PSED|nr:MULTISPECIES: hypothetical protein [Pseudomonas syringae group]KPY31960.1 Uncharacterized protein ALO52_00592 [Pseudomonas syringae pv. primulae]MBD8185399.1 hypothetical protein [Pseudomonas viridiflava]MBD8202131.1 hypothetical protein [Pseudomonas viridiflava]TKJ55779.1 hypothetical protein PviCFBP13507_25290 [Pseudomonas viridiflava]TKK24606.1 hypothetical protein PviCFBP13515_20000 [Pseudomonas viridiflava]